MGIEFEKMLRQTNEVAKQNLQRFGHLEQVVLILTDKEFLTVDLKWKTREQKRWVYRNVIDEFKERNIQFYILIGDSNLRVIGPDGTMKQTEGIVTMGETKNGEQMQIITPYARKSGKIELQKEKVLESKGRWEYPGPFSKLVR